MNIAETLDQFVAASSAANKFSLLGLETLYISDDKLTQGEIELVLAWFQEGGRFTHRINNSFFRGGNKFHSYDLRKENVEFGVGKTIIPSVRRSRGLAALGEEIGKGIAAKCDHERIEKKRAMGRTCFFEDGSLLKRVIELFGEPIDEK